MRVHGIRVLMALAVALWGADALPSGETGKAGVIRGQLLAQFGKASLNYRGGRLLRFEEVDRHLAAVMKWVRTQSWEGIPPGSLTLTFADLFAVETSDTLLPLTNTVVRLAPEVSLEGLPVRDEKGGVLGKYRYKYSYSRSGEQRYTLWFFQYETAEGRLQQTGNALLLDRYAARWSELKDRVLLSLPAPPSEWKEGE
ncbi:MAG: hypothetical protein KA419_02215 [Acidobacteria bacterium]|nr:hypothetical protein [Acidobacteriota bacterium]